MGTAVRKHITEITISEASPDAANGKFNFLKAAVGGEEFQHRIYWYEYGSHKYWALVEEKVDDDEHEKILFARFNINTKEPPTHRWEVNKSVVAGGHKPTLTPSR